MSSLLVAFALASVISLVFRPWRLTSASLWAVSVTYFVAFMSVVVQRAVSASTELRPQLGVAVLDSDAAERHIQQHNVTAQMTRVATGIFLTHMEFTSANNVQASGYVWQIYPPSTPKTLHRGVVFPETLSGGYDSFKVAYDVTRPDGTQVIGWHFNETFRQRFDYARYPFDQQDVWIRMWHIDFEQGAMLVPDFVGHPPWNPRELIGLEQQFVYSGWTPVFTTYGYLENSYESAFGLGTYKPRPPIPEMVFTTSLRRLPVGPFVNHTMPLIVIYMLTFAILLFAVKNEERSFNILSALAGLFFLTLINHQQINLVAASDGLSFLGAASAIMYMSFFGVAANGLVVARFNLSAFEWRGDLLAKLLFLPLTSLALAVAAVVIL